MVCRAERHAKPCTWPSAPYASPLFNLTVDCATHDAHTQTPFKIPQMDLAAGGREWQKPATIKNYTGKRPQTV